MAFWRLLWCFLPSVNSLSITITGGGSFLRSEHKEVPPKRHLGATVDLVYLYINGSDPEYQRVRKQAWAKLTSTDVHSDMTNATNDGQRANDMALVTDNGELLFSLRSMQRFFRGEIRKVFLVTETPPAWLNRKVLVSGELEVVHPRMIMPEGTYPNFNSRALESNLHKIPGLGEYYLTLNDDVYLGSPVLMENFFSGGVLTCHMDYKQTYDIDAFSATNEQEKGWNSHRAAMKNSNRLLDSLFGSRAGRKKVSHSPLFWSKKLVSDAHHMFHEAFQTTSSHIFRSIHDVHPGFLYSHYMLENRSIRANIQDSMEHMLVFPGGGIGGARKLCHMVALGMDNLPTYFSVNNHMSGAEERQKKGWIRGGLQALFPEPSRYEDVTMHGLDEPPPEDFCHFDPPPVPKRQPNDDTTDDEQ